eukprot:scaffold4832_cov42-Phaeocystis_antarctica.AAC.2
MLLLYILCRAVCGLWSTALRSEDTGLESDMRTRAENHRLLEIPYWTCEPKQIPSSTPLLGLGCSRSRR